MSDAISAAPAASTAAPAAIPSTTDTSSTQGQQTPPVLSPEAQASAAKVASEKAAAAMRKKFNIKVDGNFEDVELDMSNEDEIRKHLQLSKVSQKRMQESAEMRKGVQELLDTLRTNPLAVLTDPRLQIPEDIRKRLAESIINDELQEMSKSPEQREKEKLQKEYERLKSEMENEKKGREAAEFARMQEQAAVQYDNDISEAIAASGMPKNARTIRYYAEALKFCVQNDLNLTAKDLIPYVKKQALSEFREMMTALPDDDFESWLGKDQLSRIRKRNIAKAKAIEGANSIQSTGAEVNKPKEEAKKISYKNFFKSF